MSYQPNIPLASDRLSVSQGDLNTNFTQANAVYGVDHFPFDDATADATKHRRVVLPDQSATPPAPAASNGALYARTASMETFPYWRRDGTATDYPALPIKAFGHFSTNPIAIGANSFNISAVVLVATGRYRIDFIVPFPDTNYSVVALPEIGLPPQGNLFVIAYGQKAVGSVEIQFWRIDGSAFSTLRPNVSFSVLRN